MNLPTCNMLLHSYGGRHTSSQFPEVAVELGRLSGGKCMEIVLISLATAQHNMGEESLFPPGDLALAITDDRVKKCDWQSWVGSSHEN